MTERSILLIIGGGIAAYKSLLLIRELSKRGIKTRTILTKGGAEFITPLSVSGLSGEKCYQDLFDLTDETEMGHIELSRSADLLVIAPATADLLAKAANGLANDLASTALLATDKPVLMAPAMNVRMWHHAATQRNIATLKADGCQFIGPDEGDMACGEFGLGRMAEPEQIAAAIDEQLTLQTKPALHGHKVLVTAGPTHEPLDPVRYLGNRSSGKQGFAIASALARAGAEVTLIAGPVNLPAPAGVTTIRVETARQMLEMVEQSLPATVAIFCAAVADYRPEQENAQKIKKQAGGIASIPLSENPDILATISAYKSNRPELIIGFAAETENVEEHAQAKLQRKGCDWIVANDVSAATGVMGGDENSVMLITESSVDVWDRMDKKSVADKLVQKIINHLR
ncbi:MAG: bifunctional phosphopantothenoylcysteine decarboxylase/phosphopantothenate--cysteine ligase CoaBC [bacterium]